MRRILLLVITLLIFLTGTTYAQSNGLGLGLILGEPTGLSMKYWTGRTNAIDGAIAWSVGKYNGMHLHGDYLWHDYGLINVKKGRLPVYYGFGARLGFRSNDTALGIRGVAGLNYHFSGIPLDLFLELVPIFDLTPVTEFNFNAAIGVRYFF